MSERGRVAGVSDHELLSQATALATDLVTLGSLLADEPMVWFQRSAEISTGFTHTYQVPAVLPPDRHPVEPRPYFDEPQKLLRTAVPALRHWRARGLNLDRTIGFLTDARHASPATLPQRFASAFLALEMLTSFDAQDSDTEFALGRGSFDETVVPAVKAAIRESLPEDPRTRDLLYQKLRDLNRTAFSTRLTALLKRHEVRWDDLYPDGHDLAKPAFIGMRDRLFHAGDGPSDERLEFELLRIRVIVIRVLFRMLGWSGDVSYPPDGGQSWLRSYWGEELP